MSLRKILTRGDPALAKTCRPVEKFDQKLHWLLDDLKETLAHAGGVGLAAPQIGILRRAVVVEDENEELLELVNPVIVAQSDRREEAWEGCLSVPNQYGWVARPWSVTVRAQDRDGKFFEVSGEDMVARCFCHELEHLDGHLFVEHAGQLYTPDEIDAMEEEEEEEKQEKREKAGRKRGKKR